MATITIPVVDCDAEAYTPGTYRLLKPSKEPPQITLSLSVLRGYLVRGRALSAGLDFLPGDFARHGSVSIMATLQWGERRSESQRLEMVTATASNYHRGDGYSRFCAAAIPQILTLWHEHTDIPVQHFRAEPYTPGRVLWPIFRV